MKKYLLIILVIVLCFAFASCANDTSEIPTEIESQPTESVEIAAPSEAETSEATESEETDEQSEEEPMKETQFYIKANGKTLAADFADNSSADAFRELLRSGDLTVDMHDYGDFEKVGEIGHTLPQNNTQITTSPGDVILYLGSNITIYYDKNSWNFTKLGRVPDMTRKTMLDFFGSKGNVTVTFSLSK